VKNHLTAVTIGLVLLPAFSFRLSGQTASPSQAPEAINQGRSGKKKTQQRSRHQRLRVLIRMTCPEFGCYSDKKYSR
jgi:hypothetical protein